MNAQLHDQDAKFLRDWIGIDVQIDNRLEGSSLTLDGDVIFGLRAGPERSIENVVHEWSHLIETSDDEIKSFRSGSKLDYSVPGEYYYSDFAGRVVANEHIELPIARIREMRTWGVEVAVLEACFPKRMIISNLITDRANLSGYLSDQAVGLPWGRMSYRDGENLRTKKTAKGIWYVYCWARRHLDEIREVGVSRVNYLKKKFEGIDLGLYPQCLSLPIPFWNFDGSPQRTEHQTR